MQVTVDDKKYNLDAAAFEYFEERAAVREYHGNATRPEAERGAIEDLKNAISRKEKRNDADL